MHENNKASEIGKKKEAKDASSIVYVEQRYSWWSFWSDPTLLWEALANSFGPSSVQFVGICNCW